MAVRVVRDGGRALHLGAGRDSLGVTARLAPRPVVSVDLDAAGLAKNGNAVRVVADATSLPFRSDSYAGLLCENVFEHLDEPEAVLREAHRVLEPGGALVFLCPNRFSYLALGASATPHRIYVWFRRRFLTVPDVDTFETLYRLNTASRIRRLAGEVGLRVEELRSAVGWPTYWEFSDLAHRIAVAIDWLIERGPALFHVTLVGVLRKGSDLASLAEER